MHRGTGVRNEELGSRNSEFGIRNSRPPQINFEFSILNFEFPPTLPSKEAASHPGWVDRVRGDRNPERLSESMCRVHQSPGHGADLVKQPDCVACPADIDRTSLGEQAQVGVDFLG